MRVDLRKQPKAKYYGMLSKRCGVVCKSCCWRGTRVVKFLLNLNQRIDSVGASNAIRNEESTLNCPYCHGTVVFTHYLGCSSSYAGVPVLQDRDCHNTDL